MTHETEESEAYVAEVASKLQENGVVTESVVITGEPAEEIIRFAESRGVDLIAMSTHGHRGLYDLVFGSVAEEVRHGVAIPVLLVRSHV
jgi:nucleotide-binding universal stress UspA family protein